MKKCCLFIALVVSSSVVFAQQQINAEEAAKHVGDSVTICTKIFGARYFESSKGAPTLLNAGARYPDAPLTLVIYGESRPAFKNKPEEFYVDKNVCVSGRIVLYKEKPQIVLTRESEIVIKP